MATRIYGLSGSGMDVDSMVKDLMKAQRASYNTIVKKRTQLEWKKADYNKMYNAIKDFREKTVFNNKMQANLIPKKAVSSNDATASATANADAANMTHTITVAQLADGVKKSSSANITTGASKDKMVNQFTGLAAATFDITIKNGSLSKNITVDPTKSIYEFVSSINNSGTNVRANYDATLDRFFMYTTDQGSAAKIDFTGSSPAGSNFLANNLKLNTATETGKDAEFALDGIGTGILGDASNLKMSSNTFLISGVTYNLKATGTANVAISSDVEKTVANAKAFVEAYNTILSTINGELNEAKYKDYLPLTDAEKTEMKDTQITAWEDKAKSGMLRKDSILSNIVSKMRANVSEPISGLTGKYKNSASIGITTGNYAEGGKLYLDEAKLTAALNEDPDVLNKIFGTDGATGAQDGIAVRLYDTLKSSLDKISTEAGISASTSDDTTSSLAKRIRTYNTQLYNMDLRLNKIEDRYYRQFDAMESALMKLNKQSSWLSQQGNG